MYRDKDRNTVELAIYLKEHSKSYHEKNIVICSCNVRIDY